MTNNDTHLVLHKRLLNLAPVLFYSYYEWKMVSIAFLCFM